MENLSLFDDPAPPLSPLAQQLRSLADRGIYIGTSSWKYPGWLGRLYTPQRYFTRGRFSKARFEAECLAEYAETFPIVCGDFTFYQFPPPETWSRLFSSVPRTLRFAFKVPEEITVPIWPLHSRYGARAGQPNPGFLNAAMVGDQFLSPLESRRAQVAALIFEFGTLAQTIYPDGEAFAADLASFLDQLPRGWPYAVEIRNPEFLAPYHFDCLRKRATAHVFNSWTRMPALNDQIVMPGALTADFSVVRALLRPGRTYEQAVKAFAPYEEIADPYSGGRAALKTIIGRGLTDQRATYIFVNNRFEGNALKTIEAIAG